MQHMSAKPKNATTLPPSPVSGPVPPGLNDRRADDEPVVGHFVEVTDGEHKGLFGTFTELAETEDTEPQAVVVPRDNPLSRVTVPYADITPSSPNRR
jgi:hypothetical protein